MIAILVILGIFLAAFATTFWAGVPATFTYVLMPSLLLIFTVTPLEIEKLPDVTTLAAVGYGTTLAYLVKGTEPLGIRFQLIDGLVIAMSVLAVVSAVTSEQVWTGVSRSGEEFFEWLVPYFMGRAAFAHPYYRLRGAKLLTGLAVFIALVSLYELRLDPLFFSRHVLAPFGLSTTDWDMVLKRFGLFRAQATFSHPIDLGNGGALLGCIILVLATTTGRKLTTPWVLIGVGAAGVMTLASLSFTSFVAVGGIVGLYFMARLTRFAGLLLLPIAVAVIVGYAGLTMHFVETPLERPSDRDEAYDGSYYIRHLIVQSVWPYVADAGLFGHGKTIEPEEMGVKSIDNAYLLFVIREGWAYMASFLLLLVVLSIQGGAALMRIQDGRARTPLAAGIAGIVGTMLGMYTVFFGFVYARLFIILLGMTVSMCQRVFEKTSGEESDLAASPASTTPQRYRLPPGVGVTTR